MPAESRGQLPNDLGECVLKASRSPLDNYGYNIRESARLNVLLAMEVKPANQMRLPRAWVTMNDGDYIRPRRVKETFIQLVLPNFSTALIIAKPVDRSVGRHKVRFFFQTQARNSRHR